MRDYKERINNPKTELSEEKNILKPFIFREYATEAERIKDTIKKNKYLYNLPDYEDMKTKSYSTAKLDKNEISNILDEIPNKEKPIKTLNKVEMDKYEYILRKNLIIQPEMRYKPRTDLERVYDMVNTYKFGKIKRDILDKQLKRINLNQSKNTEELSELIKMKFKEQNKSKENIILKKIEQHKKNKLFFNPKSVDYKLKPWIKRDDLNKDAYKLLDAYHIKTHFKAAEEVASNRSIDNYIDSKNRNDDDEISSCLLLPNLFFNKKNMLKSFSHNNATRDNNYYDNILDDEQFKNPLKKVISFDKNKIKQLTEIAFKGKNVENEKKDEGTNDINVENEKLFANKRIDIISNKILEKYNIFKQKSIYNKNRLKKRNGKLMITHGLSVGQFEKKYGFN